MKDERLKQLIDETIAFVDQHFVHLSEEDRVRKCMERMYWFSPLVDDGMDVLEQAAAYYHIFQSFCHKHGLGYAAAIVMDDQVRTGIGGPNNASMEIIAALMLRLPQTVRKDLANLAKLLLDPATNL